MKPVLLVQIFMLSLFLTTNGCKDKTDPPGKPTNLALSVISQTEIDLSWSDNSSNESGFKIERLQGSGTAWSVIASTSADVRTFKNTGLTAGTNYSFKIMAFNSAGNSEYSNIATASTLAAPILPSVTTASVSSVTYNSALCGGNVTLDGNSPVTARGICWSTSANPSVNDQKTTDGSGTGAFTSSMTSLYSGTQYYVRAYATNSVGTSYGDAVTFTTSAPPVIPSVTTLAASSVTTTSASTGGNITSDGGASVTSRGVCYGVNPNPTIAGSKTSDGTGTGSFTTSLSGLTPCTTYHIRAYATNPAGTAYGSDLQFTTGTVTVSVVTTSASAISGTSATSGGSISGDCASSVTSKGVCYSTSPNPTTADTKTSDGTGGGSYTSSLTGLVPSTTYYARAYAINPAGASYGSVISFTTTASPPTVSTTAASSVTTTSASAGGNVTSDGGASVTARGICYSTSANPTTSDPKTTDGAGPGTFTSTLAGLTPCTTYHIRAYATNSAGTSYGNDLQFTTGTTTVSVTTTAISGISSSGAASGGTITGDCAATVTARGVCYSTTANPTTSNSKTSDGTGGGTFTSTITGLTANTIYHVRAYATNPAGTVYGADVQFTTSPGLPVVTTSSLTMNSSTAANAGGNVTSDGGAAVTAKGVCWNTSTNPTISNSKTIDGSGTGSFSSSLTGLTPGTTYYVRAYATNSAGTSYGSNISFVAPARVSDIDGNAYNVVEINSLQWMQQNLKVTRFNDGSNLVPYTDTAYVPVSYYHMYNNNSTYGTTYGYLYNGYVLSSGKNICPTGWHVPAITEWSSLSTYLGGTSAAGGKMKETGTTYWNSPNTGADNSSGFSARGGGYYFNTYADLKNSSIWWSNTSKRYVRIDYNSAGISGISSTLTGTDENSFYIRCKKD